MHYEREVRYKKKKRDKIVELLCNIYIATNAG